jgi:acetyltransferase
VVRALSDPDNEEAEFGVIVRSELKGGGLGLLLMRKLIDYLRSQGTARLVAHVLDQNDRMLKLANALGFKEITQERHDDGTTRITLPLT